MKTIGRAATSGTILAAFGLLAGCHPSSEGNAIAANASAPMGNMAAALPGLPASLPLQGGPATSNGSAPPVSRLPAAPRPALRQLVGASAPYAYLDRAASYDDAIGEAPPDYAFGYDGVTPWGWQADDGSAEYAEPFDGGYRYYYYEPGADTPYLVRDPSYSYAFDAGALVAIYDLTGRVVPRGSYGPRWDDAGRYVARARALRAAAASARQSVIAANWAAHRAQIAAADASWDAARARDAAWAAYHAQNANAQRSHWQGERDARAQAAERFADFQRQGLQGPLPDPGRPDGAAAPQRFGGAALGGAAIAGAAVAGGAAVLAHRHGPAATPPQPAAPGRQVPPAFFGQRRRDGGATPHAPQRPFAAERQQAMQARAQAARAGFGQQRAAVQPQRQQGPARMIARGGFGQQAVAEHHGPLSVHHVPAPRAEVAPQRAFVAPQPRGGEMAHAEPNMAPPRMAPERIATPHGAPPHMEAPHMAPPRAEAPHTTAPHAVAPPHLMPAAHPHPAMHAGPPHDGGHHH